MNEPGPYQEGAVAVMIATVLAVALLRPAWWLDQEVLRCGSLKRFWIAAALLAVGVWVSVLILTAYLLEVPGRYGPVQFWWEEGRWFLGVRAVAFLLMLAGFPVVLGFAVRAFAVVTESTFSRGDRLRRNRLILPSIGIAAYAVAFCLFGVFNFMPSA